jgi:hypothetical protein
MKRPRKGPGRPRKPDALTPAERMRASRSRKRKAGFRTLQSWVSTAPRVYADHMRLDARSLALHCLVARKIVSDPALVEQARTNLLRWKERASAPVPSYFEEWERILLRRPEEVAGFLVSMTEEATRLRQSSPFATLLRSDERAKVYAAFQ